MRNKIKRICTIGLTLSLLLGVGANSSLSISANSHHSWSWTRSLSVHRALHNTSKRQDERVKVESDRDDHISQRIKSFYHVLRKNHYSYSQSIAILMVIHNRTPSFTQSKINEKSIYQHRTIGYFDLTDRSKADFIHFAHSDREDPNLLITQLNFLVKMFGNSSFKHRFDTDHNCYNLATIFNRDLIDGETINFYHNDLQYINSRI